MHTCIQFHPKKPIIVITCASNEFFLYDVENNSLIKWSQMHSHQLPEKFLNRTEPILGVAFDSVRDDAFVLWGASYLCTIDMNLPMPSKDAFLTVAHKAIHMDHRYQSLMFVKGFSRELVIMERPVLHVLAELPPAFSKSKYAS